MSRTRRIPGFCTPFYQPAGEMFAARRANWRFTTDAAAAASNSLTVAARHRDEHGAYAAHFYWRNWNAFRKPLIDRNYGRDV